jgi:hypothetical protein
MSVSSPTLLVYRANARSAKSLAAVTESLVGHLHHLVDELPCSILKCATSAVISELRLLCMHAVCNAMLHSNTHYRWPSRMSLAKVRGRCAAVSLGRDTALFYAADTGEADGFNITCLCWTSYKVRF